MSDIEFALRLAAAVGCGVVIGLERQWRQRMAGLRTNALVAAGACLFVLLQVSMSTGANGDRIVAQIVSGVGFLGAGVIMREGLSVRGINTAATIWCSAAVGCLAGVGLFLFAFAGAAVIVFANVLLRPVARGVSRQAESTELGYQLRIVGRPGGAMRLRALLLQTIAGSNLQLRGIETELAEDLASIEVRATILVGPRGNGLIASVISRLGLEEEISAVRCLALEDDLEADPPLVPGPAQGRLGNRLAFWRRLAPA
ncbi:MAG TPA: MgtC/SapB family protein [Candidatus Dormibacteraeota bacterium]|jgi:putative Mg2+ transporter-C (MgtC) family protein|nr:MgtC/SapB family protein [Candidatus Dormibacteraeota bacterium]